MQLKPGAAAIRHGLIAASCALLSTAPVRAQETPATPLAEPGEDSGQLDWLLQSALAYYHENGRVQAIEPIVDLSRDNGDGELIDLNLTFDSLSGASPNGALTSRQPQTFAAPSGKTLSAAPHTYTTASGQLVTQSAAIYTTPAGQLPVDPNYHDQRLAVGGSWQIPLSRLLRWSVGGKLSYEHDFFSVSANTSVARDFNDKNTTVLFGLNDEADAIRPIGGTPVAGSDYTLFEKTGSTSKNGVGGMLGLTQVMNRRWLAQLNLTADRFSGYLNDPYKILSIIDSAGNTTGYLYERRPHERNRESLFLENRVAGDYSSAALSLRYMTDDWHIRSETAELRPRLWSGSREQYWEPTLRWYRQSAAYFYRPWILNTAGSALGEASADMRLGAFHALTYGLEYGVKLDGLLEDAPNSAFTVRLEYYQQTMEHTLPAPGTLQGLELYPGLKALLLQFGFSY